jgi:tetratricopeptide (TPR) repeat protein
MGRVALFLFIALNLAYAQEDVFRLAKDLEENGQHELALDLYEGLYERNPGTDTGLRALFEKARVRSELGDTSGARTDISTLLSKNIQESIASSSYELLVRLEPDTLSKARLLLEFANRFPFSDRAEEFLSLSSSFSVAARSYRTALRATRSLSSRNTENRGRYQIQAGRLHFLLSEMGRAELLLSRYPGDDLAKYYAAELHLARFDTARALLLLEDCEVKGSASLELRIRFALSDRTGALEVLNRRLDESSTDPEIAAIQALLLLREGRAEEALSHEALIQDSLVLGELLLRAGRPERALELLRDREEPRARALRARASLARGDLLAAYLEARELGLDVATDSLRMDIARIMIDRGYHGEAASLLSSCERYYPGEEVLLLLKEALERAGRESEAAPIADSLEDLGYRARVRPSPAEVQAILKRSLQGMESREIARSLLDIGAYDEVTEMYQDRGEIKAAEALLYIEALIRLFVYEGDPSYALRADNLLAKLPPEDRLPLYLELHAEYRPEDVLLAEEQIAGLPPRSLLHLATIYRGSGRHEGCREILETLRNKGVPRLSDELRSALFHYYVAEGLLDSAYTHLDESRLPERVLLARAHRDRGDREVALALLRDTEPRGFRADEEAVFLRIRLAREFIEFEEIEDLAPRYLAAYPGSDRSGDVRRILGETELTLGRPERAYTALLGETGIEARSLRALALIEMGEIEKARSLKPLTPETRWLIDLEDGQADTLPSTLSYRDRAHVEEFVLLRCESGESPELELLRESGIFNEEEIELLHGKCLARSGRYEEAVALLEALSAKARGELRYEIGLALFKAGELEDARAHLFKALQWGDLRTRGLAAFKLATALFSENRFTEAADYYRMALDLVEDETIRRNALYNASIAYTRMNQADSAAALKQRLAESYPSREESLEALLSLAFLHQERGEFEEALRIYSGLEGELRTEEEEAELLYWRGEIHFVRDDLETALLEFRKLYTFYPDLENWTVTAELRAAKILAALARTEEAREILERIVAVRGTEDNFGRIAREDLDALGPE